MKSFLKIGCAALAGLGGLTACRSGEQDNYVILSHFDPDITTLSSEIARNTARNASDTIRLQTGKYCQGFQESFGSQFVTARFEFTVRPGSLYQIAGRYTYNNLVRNQNEIGTFLIRKHALILVNQAGQERTWAITSAGDDQIGIYGELPLTRDACAAPPLSGQAYLTAAKAAAAEASAPAPWDNRSAP